MKWLIASDIHGSAKYCEKLIRAFETEGADRLLLLGDILYHGPRNDLPEEYAPKLVTAMLNGMSEKITCVRGNCDAEVDQMVLDFPIMADYVMIEEGGVRVFATHGHIYDEEHPPKISGEFVLLHGHTHVQVCEKREGFTYVNPGSVSLPKDGKRGYCIFENGRFTLKEFED